MTLQLDKTSLTMTITFLLLATFTLGYLASWFVYKYQLKSLLEREKVNIQKSKASKKVSTKEQLKSEKG